MLNEKLEYRPQSAVAKEMGGSWVWFLALGTLFVLLGLACIVGDFVVALTTVAIFGWALVIGGLFALIHGFRAKSSSGFLFLLLNALFRMTTGCLLILFPLAGATSLTLMLASFFIVIGLFRAIGAGAMKPPRWGWSFFSGFVSVAMGVILLELMPVSSTWLIGLAVGGDLVVEGAATIGFATAIHRLSRLSVPISRPKSPVQ